MKLVIQILIVLQVVCMIILLTACDCGKNKTQSTKDKWGNTTQTVVPEKEKKVKLVKVEFNDGHIEVFECEYIWNDGEGETARIHIDTDTKDTYIMLKNIKRYQEYYGLKSEVTKEKIKVFQ